MDQEQFSELSNRIDRVENDVLDRLDRLEKSSTWFGRHSGIILSTITILATLAAAWGRLETSISHLQQRDSALQQQLDNMTSLIRGHHEDTRVHTDRVWRGEVKQELVEIRNLLLRHMEDSTSRK